MRTMRGNLERRKWVIMAVDEAEDVFVPPCLFGVCEYASMGGFLVFCFMFFCFFCSFVFLEEKRRQWKL